MNRRLIAIIVFFLSITYCSAQQGTGVYFGYNVGAYFFPFRNLQNVAYTFNKNYGENVTESMKISPFYKGVNVGWHITAGNYGFDANWSNKHTINTAKRLDNGQERTVALKTRINTLQLGGHYVIKEKFCLRGSLHIGMFKVLKKDTFTSAFSAGKYENFYDQNGIATALSVYAMKNFYLVGGSGILLKPYLEWYYVAPRTLHGPMVTNYIFRTTNIGITTALNLGTKENL